MLGGWLGLPAVFLIAGVGGIATGAVTWVVLYRFRAPIAAAFDADPDTDPAGGSTPRT